MAEQTHTHTHTHTVEDGMRVELKCHRAGAVQEEKKEKSEGGISEVEKKILNMSAKICGKSK